MIKLVKRQPVKKAFDEPVPFELYLPQTPGPFPLICITPILGRLVFFEDLLFERRFARFFALHGFAVALIDRPIFEFNPNRGLEQIEEYLSASVSRNQRVLDTLVSHKEIDAKRVASFGISFGAVVNSLWAAKDCRLKAHVFSLAGGNLPEILTTSRDPLMRNYINSILKSRSFPTNRNDLLEAFRKTLRAEPLEAARSISKENVLLLLAVFDRVIRFRFGLAFRKALGDPETLFLPLGHYTTILAVPLLKWRVLKFFQKKL